MSYISEAPIPVGAGLRQSARLLSYRNVGLITAVADYLLIVAASVLAGVGYHLVALGYVVDIRGFAGIGSHAGLLFVLLAKSQHLYRPSTLLWMRQVRGVVVAWGVVLLAIVSLLFLLKLGEEYSRGATVGFGVVGLMLLIGSRAVIANRLRDAVATGNLTGQRAILLGDRKELAYYSAVELLRTYGVQEIERFELSATDAGDKSAMDVDDKISIGAAIGVARSSDAEMVLLALPWTDTARYEFVRQNLRALPVPALLLPDRSARSILSQPRVEIGADYAIELQRAPLTPLERGVKRAFDIVGAGALLILLSPLLALVSIAIKLNSSGPVVFRQHRKGFNGRKFTIYKFRTMTVAEDGPVIRQAQRNDARVTSLGFYLRATSIDELPQLINVLRGEMSLVGPRPHAIAHDDEYSKLIANYAFRHHVKPGITGWAQVSGFRGETARLELMERRVDLDLWYINNWSIWLDLWILIRTCLVVPRSMNAY
ncbi:MAG TPA: undecaprenyl-phosphate glucose phosphotransferase [Hyphomicrobiaceae bacterium]|nr:undecaprenyl-phosphate glucose phosphotransferase [Hyphomicrobiaceae bacterium]